MLWRPITRELTGKVKAAMVLFCAHTEMLSDPEVEYVSSERLLKADRIYNYR